MKMLRDVEPRTLKSPARARLPLALGRLFTTAALLWACAASGTDAPGAPGAPSVWGPAAKEFLGASAGASSQVYFTGARGVVTEVFYPSPDRVQNVDLQLIVVDAAKTWGARTSRGTAPETARDLPAQQTGAALAGGHHRRHRQVEDHQARLHRSGPAQPGSTDHL